MDWHWYDIQGGSGGGGGDKPADLETETITVTEDQTTADWKTDRISPDALAWQVEAFRVEGEVKEPVAVSASTTSSDNSTAFHIAWVTPFNGVIEITTWTKKIQ